MDYWRGVSVAVFSFGERKENKIKKHDIQPYRQSRQPCLSPNFLFEKTQLSCVQERYQSQLCFEQLYGPFLMSTLGKR